MNAVAKVYEFHYFQNLWIRVYAVVLKIHRHQNRYF